MAKNHEGLKTMNETKETLCQKRTKGTRIQFTGETLGQDGLSPSPASVKAGRSVVRGPICACARPQAGHLPGCNPSPAESARKLQARLPGTRTHAPPRPAQPANPEAARPG